MTTFTVSGDRIRTLAKKGNLVSGNVRLADAKMIGVSGVLAKDVEAPRFKAVLDTVRSSSMRRIFHMIMLDNASHRDAEALLRRAGAGVVTIDNESEGGVARPYVIAAQIIDEFAPNALMVKAEGEKSIFALMSTVDNLWNAGKRLDIINGERDDYTWSTMPPYQVATETWLGYAIGMALGVSVDTPSGVLALNRVGREVFIQTTTENSWPYLFVTPYYGMRRDLRVGAVPVGFKYHDAVVQEETGNPKFDQKRRDQLDLMIGAALKLVGGTDNLGQRAKEAVTMLRRYRLGLERLNDI